MTAKTAHWPLVPGMRRHVLARATSPMCGARGTGRSRSCWTSHERILAPVGLGRRGRVVTFQGTPRSSALPARAAQIQGRSVARTARQRHEPSGRPEGSGARCRVSRWDGLTDRVGSIGWRVTTSNGCSGFGTGGVVSRGLQPNLTVVGSETRRPKPLDRRPHSQSSKAAHLTSFDQVILRHQR